MSAGLCAVTKVADCTAIGQSDLGQFLTLLFDLGDTELLEVAEMRISCTCNPYVLQLGLRRVRNVSSG